MIYNDAAPPVHMVDDFLESLAADRVPEDVYRTVLLQDVFESFGLVVEGDVDAKLIAKIIDLVGGPCRRDDLQTFGLGDLAYDTDVEHLS